MDDGPRLGDDGVGEPGMKLWFSHSSPGGGDATRVVNGSGDSRPGAYRCTWRSSVEEGA